jgi:CubicO group peptidase (beta-lactamase class C family)
MADTGFTVAGGKLGRPSVEVMTTDQLTAEQKAENEVFLGGDSGWGFGFNVRTRRTGLASPGQFDWTGGTGTTVYTDPAEELIGILLTQRAVGLVSPGRGAGWHSPAVPGWSRRRAGPARPARPGTARG